MSARAEALALLIVLCLPQPAYFYHSPPLTATPRTPRAAGIEEAVNPRAPDDAARSVMFRFFESAGGKEARRTIMFVSRRQKEAFVAEVEKLNPRLIVKKKDGSLGSSADRDKAAADAKKDAAGKLAEQAQAGDSSGSGAAAAEEEEDNDAGLRFFAMEENDYGFSEPRVLTFDDSVPPGGEHILHVVDATAAGKASSDLRLRRLKTIAVHASDKSTLALAMHDGSMHRTTVRVVVLTFGNRVQRERFYKVLTARVDDAGLKGSVDIDNNWRTALPTKLFYRFDVTRLRPKKLTCTLLVNARRKQIVIVKSGAIPGYQPGGLIPSNVSTYTATQLHSS